MWHSMAANPSSEDRVGAVVRYAPWWLNCNGNLTSHRLTPRMVPFAYLTSNSADWRLSESTSRCGCTTQMCGCDRLIELLLLWHARQALCADRLERHIIYMSCTGPARDICAVAPGGAAIVPPRGRGRGGWHGTGEAAMDGATSTARSLVRSRDKSIAPLSYPSYMYGRSSLDPTHPPLIHARAHP